MTNFLYPELSLLDSSLIPWLSPHLPFIFTLLFEFCLALSLPFYFSFLLLLPWILSAVYLAQGRYSVLKPKSQVSIMEPTPEFVHQHKLLPSIN
jgi:hypothetical protein